MEMFSCGTYLKTKMMVKRIKIEEGDKVVVCVVTYIWVIKIRVYNNKNSNTARR